MKQLLLLFSSYTIISNYIAIFVNLYVWQTRHSVTDLCIYNGALFFSWGFGFTLGSYLLTRRSIRWPAVVSALFGGSSFAVLFALKVPSHVLWLFLIGLPVGAFSGVFSATQNMGVSMTLKKSDFSRYFSVSGIIGLVIAIINPIVSAYVIQQFGYNGSFVLMFVFVVSMVLTASRLPKATLAGTMPQGVTFFTGIRYRTLFSTRKLKLMFYGFLIAGVFLQFQGLFSLIFTFSVTQNKFVIALLNIGYTLAAVFALFWYKRLKLRDTTWLYVGTFSIVGGLAIALFFVPAALVASNILTTVGLYFFGVVWNSQQFRTLSVLPARVQAQIYTWRECALCVTRILTLTLFPFLHEFRVFIPLSLFILAISAALVLFCQSRSVATEDAVDEMIAAPVEAREPVLKS